VQLHPQGFLGEVADGQAALVAAAVELQAEVLERQAVAGALQAGVQFGAFQAVGGRHGRQGLADAVEKGAQVELGNRQAAAQLRIALQVADVQFAQGAQLVDRKLQPTPFGDIFRQVGHQLALGRERGALALQHVAGDFTGQAHVFELIALGLAVESQFAGQFGAGAHHRLVGAQKSGQFDRDVDAFMNGTGAELDAVGGQLATALGVAVVNRSVVDRQAVHIQLDLPGVGRFGRGRAAGGRVFAVGRSGCGGIGQGLADVFPVAMAVFIARQSQVKPLDAHVAHLDLVTQQGQHTDRQAEHLQFGEGLLGIVQGGDAGIVQFQPEPGEQAPADIAVERQFHVGLVAGQLADFVFVVVGIEQMAEGEAQGHDDQQQPENTQPQDFAERFHRRVL
jgi:hypothetical protein